MGPRPADFNLRINNLTFGEREGAAGPITGNVFAGAEPFLTDDKIPVLRGQLGTALGEGEALRIVSVHGGKETLLGLATLAPRGQGGFTGQLVLGASPDGGGELPDGHSPLSARVVDAASGQTHNLHNLLNHWEFLGYGMLAVLLAAVVSYPFAMNFARRAALFVSRKVSHEAIIATFVGLIIVISVWEGQFPVSYTHLILA